MNWSFFKLFFFLISQQVTRSTCYTPKELCPATDSVEISQRNCFGGVEKNINSKCICLDRKRTKLHSKNKKIHHEKCGCGCVG